MAPAFPKPEPRKRAKGRKKRLEQKVVKTVRPDVVRRDGYCRLLFTARTLREMFGVCRGASQWAHFGKHKRARTRGMAPEVRHTTAGTFMLCDGHHDAYDDGEIVIHALTEKECDGPLEFRVKDRPELVYREEAA